MAAVCLFLYAGLLPAQDDRASLDEARIFRPLDPPRRLPEPPDARLAEPGPLPQRPIRLPSVQAAPLALVPADACGPMPADSSAVMLASRTTAAELTDDGLKVSGTAQVDPEINGAESYGLDELKAEMKQLAWTKGDVRIVPYGVLWGSALYSTSRTSPGPYTLFVPSLDDEGEDDFVIDTRRTRIGLDVAGPMMANLGCAQTGGKIEIDFHGAFVVENKPGVLLRHAYGEIKNENFRLLAGQTWDVISPLYPGTMSYSVGWGGGNIGYRRMQIRLERYRTFSDRLQFTAAGSVNQNIVSDFTAAADVDPEASDWPLFEGRLGATLGRRGAHCNPAAFGLSGHIGEQGFDFTAAGPAPLNLPPRDDARVPTWSLNLDARIPFGERFGVQGEFFTGQNLGTFLGGVVQGVDHVSRRGIRSTGGWFDVWYDWLPCLHSCGGFGIDDPRDNDVFSGRIYNHFFFANSSFDLTDKLTLGMEVSSWKTLYVGQRPGESVQFEFTGKYAF
jgi:hypothetical protein